ncbi:MAG: Uma2 family endonuclease [Anaerolineae bacterium]|nr:Uma2 family endonuclease [Anaerolineae bacterium]MDQ7034054.1 Uma2 family endonuclease [Anaerolineae bacterium]
MTEKIKTITQNDLIRLEAESDDFSIEVDDGLIVKVGRNMTWLHMLIIRNLYEILVAYVRANNLGWVMPDGVRYILDGDTEDVQRAYKPDLSYLRTGRISDDFDWSGDFDGAPEFAAEVASPGQGIPYFLRRVDRFLEAGVEEVWVIYPSRKEVHQYRMGDDAPLTFKEHDTISTPLFPNLQINVTALFKKEA